MSKQQNELLSEVLGACDFNAAVRSVQAQLSGASLGRALFRMYDACSHIDVGSTGLGEELNSPGAMRGLLMTCAIPLGEGGFPLGAGRDFGEWQNFMTHRKFDQKFASALALRITRQQRTAILREMRSSQRDIAAMEPLFHTTFDRVMKYLEDLGKDLDLFPGTDIVSMAQEEGLSLPALPNYFHRMRDLLLYAQSFREGSPSHIINGYWIATTGILIRYQELVDATSRAGSTSATEATPSATPPNALPEKSTPRSDRIQLELPD